MWFLTRSQSQQRHEIFTRYFFIIRNVGLRFPSLHTILEPTWYTVTRFTSIKMARVLIEFSASEFHLHTRRMNQNKIVKEPDSQHHQWIHHCLLLFLYDLIMTFKVFKRKWKCNCVLFILKALNKALNSVSGRHNVG